MNKEVMYIAGPMRGLPDLGRWNFHQATMFLIKRTDYIILNPAKLPQGMNPDSYMPICLAMLREADAIGLLPGWENSAGALLEKAFAEQTGKQVIDIAKEYGFEYPEQGETEGRK